MKKEVGAFEAKTNLAKLLTAVERGDAFTITRRGEAVAQLIPAHQSVEKDVSTTVASFRKWRQGITWGDGMSTDQAKKEGRR